jgi:hypothetical protein
MADPKPKATASTKKPANVYAIVGMFTSPADLYHACEHLRDQGFRDFDAHTPFPVHGLEKAMGLRPSVIPWIVLGGGITGLATAFTMQWWMGGIDYPWIISGKPPFALQSSIPIMFELTVLLSAFGTVLGMFHLNRLPRHHHPIFNSDRFRGFSDDKFFVSVESTDPKWSLEKTKKLFEDAHAEHVELLYDDDEGGADFEPTEEAAH